MNSMKMFLFVIFLFVAYAVSGQNKYEDTFPYEVINGKMIVKAKVMGNPKEYKFLLDISSRSAVLSKYEKELGITGSASSGKEFFREGIEVVSEGIANGLMVGSNVFLEKLRISIIKDTDLEKLGVAGILGANVFADYVVTINSRDKSIATTTPYKPSYVKAKNRSDLKNNLTGLQIGNQVISVGFDLLSDKVLSLTDADFNKVKPDMKGDVLAKFVFANNSFENQKVYTASSVKRSTLGAKVLEHGLISIDYPNSKIYFQSFTDLVMPKKVPEAETRMVSGEPQDLTRTMFLKNIFNYRELENWKYQGNKPAVIDFWATWCGPCKQLSPIYDQLAKEYEGKVVFYKVNVDEEKELRDYYKANAIPMLIFIPMKGEPITRIAITKKEEIKQIIDDKLLK